MFDFIDKFLNGTTMYRLVLYYLMLLYVIAVIFSFFGILPYQPPAIIASAFVIIASCWVANTVFSRVFRAPTNVESAYITALILVLIITPPPISGIFLALPFLITVSVLAMASKYILAINKKHVFNPAAFAVALTALSVNQSASWWVGNLFMVPFVIIGGLIIVRKILRKDLVISFLIAAAFSILGFAVFKGSNLLSVAGKTFFETPILFFAFVMITEPLTTPPTKILRICYGALTGLLFAPAIHLGQIYSTPELALLAGNIFSFLVSPKGRHVLKLKEKKQIAPEIYDFIFSDDRKFSFKPGQYLEWTLGHRRPDSRGNRRYFTIASSPTEKEIRLGVKFYNNSSSFKKSLISLEVGGEIAASQPAGDFTLPRNKNRKLVFIAGGIGITPFRSMIKYLLDRKEKRSIVLFYSAKKLSDIIYVDVLDEACEKLDMKIVCTLTDRDAIPPLWRGERGFITGEMVKKEIPDYQERIFYISGPHSMVAAFGEILKDIGVGKKRIKTDFFPGLV